MPAIRLRPVSRFSLKYGAKHASGKTREKRVVKKGKTEGMLVVSLYIVKKEP